MEFVLDFNYNDDVAQLYLQSNEHEFTTEYSQNPRQFTLDQIKTRLHEISKSKNKNGFDLHGILKVYKDNKLVAISFPRPVISAEYDKFSLDPTRQFHRLSGIFIDEECRGQGISKQITDWFIDKFKNILWTAHTTNSASIKAALKAGLVEIKERDVVGSEGEILFRTKVFSN